MGGMSLEGITYQNDNSGYLMCQGKTTLPFLNEIQWYQLISIINSEVKSINIVASHTDGGISPDSHICSNKGSQGELQQQKPRH